MRSHKHHYRLGFGFAERRLCANHIGTGLESLGNARQAVEAHEDIENNPHIQKALLYYDNKLLRSEFPELKGDSMERPYLLTLLTDGVINDNVNADYRSLDKGDVDAFDPFNLAEQHKNAADMGKFLKSYLDDKVLKDIHVDGANASDKALGQAYHDIVGQQRLLTSKDKPVDNTIFVQVNLHWYRHVQQKIDTSLKQHAVRPPDRSMEFFGDRGANPNMKAKLTPEEYLVLIKNGIADETKTEFKDSRALIKAARKPASPLGKRTEKVFTDISLTNFGPSETLKRFDIQIGDVARRRYVDARMGVVRGTDGVQAPEGMPAAPETIPSAAEWRRNPLIAYKFLSENMPSAIGSSNHIFLESLKWHLVFNDSERAGEVKPVPLMSSEDVRAVLALVTQSFIEYENVITESSRQQVDLKKEVTFAKNAEDFMANAWEYMKDFSSHPLGSGLMWATAIIAARNLLKVFKGKTKLAVALPIGALAFGLYQQHTKGRAWWNLFTDKYDELMEKENLKDPQKRTLPNYWTRSLKDIEGAPGQFKDLTPEKERLSLSLIGSVPVGETLDWYDKWRIYRNNPGNNTPPRLPIDYYEYFHIYGNSATEETVGEYLFMSMQKFFIHRGKDVKRQQLQFSVPGGLSDDEGLGYAYIKEKYVEHRLYSRILEDIGIEEGLQFTDAQIRLLRNGKKMSDAEIKQKFPEGYDIIKKFNDMTAAERKKNINMLLFVMNLQRTEKIGVPSVNYPFNHVFFMEGNPEAMAAIDSQNAGTLSSWEKVVSLFRGKANKLPPTAAPTAPATTSSGTASSTATSSAAPSSSQSASNTPSSSASTTPSSNASTNPSGTASPSAGPSPSPSPSANASSAPASGPQSSPSPSPSANPAPSPSTTPAPDSTQNPSGTAGSNPSTGGTPNAPGGGN